jgi:hypothetical protein
MTSGQRPTDPNSAESARLSGFNCAHRPGEPTASTSGDCRAWIQGSRFHQPRRELGVSRAVWRAIRYGRNGCGEGGCRLGPSRLSLGFLLPYIYSPNIFGVVCRSLGLTRRFNFECRQILVGNVQVGLAHRKKCPNFSARCGLSSDLVVFEMHIELANIPKPPLVTNGKEPSIPSTDASPAPTA